MVPRDGEAVALQEALAVPMGSVGASQAMEVLEGQVDPLVDVEGEKESATAAVRKVSAKAEGAKAAKTADDHQGTHQTVRTTTTDRRGWRGPG